MGIYKQTDTKHTQVRIEQASSAKNCSEGEMLRHFNALYNYSIFITLWTSIDKQTQGPYYIRHNRMQKHLSLYRTLLG